MPIKPENRKLYPKNWKAIRAEVMERAGSRCECVGECGVTHPLTDNIPNRCPQSHGLQFVKQVVDSDEFGEVKIYGTIVLTIAHLNHNPKDSRRANLKAMCQKCHLRYDKELHQRNASDTRDRRRGQLRLPLL